jgi:hypothetical protein
MVSPKVSALLEVLLKQSDLRRSRDAAKSAPQAAA